MDHQQERRADMILGIVVGGLVLALGAAVLLNDPFERATSQPTKVSSESSGWNLDWMKRHSDGDGRPPPANAPPGEPDPDETPIEHEWPDAPVTRKVGEARFDFSFLPAGNFEMGDNEGVPNQRPARRVRVLRKFHIANTPVTVAQFRQFVDSTSYRTDAESQRWSGDGPLETPGRFRHWRTPGFTQEADDPVLCVSRRDAMAFTTWLSQQWGEPIRLPTEAEWEYAARLAAGDAAASQVQASGPPAGTIAVPPGSTILEWCLDVYHDTYVGAPTDSKPWMKEDWLPEPAVRFALRGITPHLASQDLATVAARHSRSETHSAGTIGFRVIRSRHVWPTEVVATRSWDRRPSTSKTHPPESREFDLPELQVRVARMQPGRFQQGGPGLGPSALPVREVDIPGGWAIGITEVTVGQFRRFVESAGYLTDAERLGGGFVPDRRGEWEGRPGTSWRQPGFPQSDRHPVVMISWWDAMAYCRWASELTGKLVRLPSEAEWEYACRAGETTQLPEDPDRYAWHLDNAQLGTQPVATKAPNGWGLFDFRGNAWEWCLDSWSPSLEALPQDGRPSFAGDGFNPVMRGGSFAGSERLLQASRREPAQFPGRVNQSQGFRIVVE